VPGRRWFHIMTSGAWSISSVPCKTAIWAPWAADITKIVDANRKKLARGNDGCDPRTVSNHADFVQRIAGGLALAIVLVYALIVINFQSWLDPFIIITALPAALAGIVFFLFATHTTISVPALMGAIMSVGVATSNSVLVVSFAKERLEAGETPAQAALDAGFVRFRPVLMTALAMIIGMIPMALGLGEGGGAECSARPRSDRRPDFLRRVPRCSLSPPFSA